MVGSDLNFAPFCGAKEVGAQNGAGSKHGEHQGEKDATSQWLLNRSAFLLVFCFLPVGPKKRLTNKNLYTKGKMKKNCTNHQTQTNLTASFQRFEPFRSSRSFWMRTAVAISQAGSVVAIGYGSKPTVGTVWE